jgi:predicted kinase
MVKPFLLLLDGMTGAGKTTTTKLLAKKLPRTAIIGMDKIKKFISDFERGERDNTIARDIVLLMTKKYFDHGLSVIVDQPFKTQEEIIQYENLAKEYSLKCYKFQLFASPEVAFSRVVNRQKDLEDKVPEERVQRNISLFQKRDHLDFIIIDTSDLDENVASELILEKIAKDK